MTAQNTNETVIARTQDAAISSKKQLVPELRFKEFDSEWEKIEFGKLAEFKNGLNFSKEQEGIGLKVIGVGDFKNHMSISYDELSKVNVPEKQKEAYLLKDNDILFVRSNGNKELIGRALFLSNVKEELGYSGFTIRARFNSFEDIHPYFYAIYFKSSAPKQQFLLLGGGTNISNLNQQILSGLEMPKPSLPEQQKIATFISAVDTKIQQLSKKKELLEQYKKGVMQQLFSGELRFKDDEGKDYQNWEDKKLGEVAYITTGSSNRVDSSLDGEFTFFDRSEDIRTSSIYLFDGEAVIVAGEGQRFIPKYFVGKFDLHQRSYAIMNFNGCNGKYIFYHIGFHTNYLLSQAVGSTVKSLRLPMFKEMKIHFPSLKEQQKIATFLSNIDTKIESVNQQITQTQSFKKGLLQKMFV